MTIATAAIPNGATITGISAPEWQIRCDLAPPRLIEDGKPDYRT